MAYPLNVAFVWHMHQPYYKDSLAETYTLPWVRLHATKDYLHVAEVLAEHPEVHQSFNFVPSLVEQLRDYGAGRAIDRALGASLGVARGEPLDAATKAYLLDFFFSINHDRFVGRYPRYTHLLRMRDAAAGDAKLLSDTFYRDLVVWFNLAWIDPSYIARDAELTALVDKGRDFSPADLRVVLDRHQRICAAVLPLYRKLAERGQVELTTSPYFHPIVPLLVDTRAARVASPWLTLPNTLFASAEDAGEQMRRAVELHTEVFGSPPRGVWPPEGSVSTAGIEVIEPHLRQTDGAGLNWLATDEGILARSLGVTFGRDGYGSLYDPRALYQPYLAGNRPMAMIFRDQVLSDRIGFVYQHWDAWDAARDLVGRLDQMADRLGGDDQHYLAPIILDGENCWEEYANNGHDFLHALFTLLERDPKLHSVKVSEYLDAHPPRQTLQKVFAGSWIGSNFETWIGESAQNRAWEYLTLARTRLVAWQRERGIEDVKTLEAAWREIYIAEGSDWFWWYYSRNNGGTIMPFDADFRAHIGNVYQIMGLPRPSWLDHPIESTLPEHARAITAYVTARIAADEPIHPEWNGSGFVEPDVSTGSMQRGATLLRRLYYGYTPTELCLRLESNDDLRRCEVAFYLATPDDERANPTVRYRSGEYAADGDLSLGWEIRVPVDATVGNLSRAGGNGLWVPAGEVSAVARGPRVCEMRLPLAQVGLSLGDTLSVISAVAVADVLADVLPTRDAVGFTLMPLP